MISGAAGAVVGLLLGLAQAATALWGEWSFAVWAAVAAAVAAAVCSAVGYWRARTVERAVAPQITSLRYVISTVSVVIAHVALATIATLALCRPRAVLHRRAAERVLDDRPARRHGGDRRVADVPVGIPHHDAAPHQPPRELHRDRHDRRHAHDERPEMVEYHFSQLGTFDDLSSFLFNGTLIAGGLLVTTFTLYVGHDLRGIGESSRGTRIVTTALAIMGVMLACVGIFPVDVNMLLHNLSASGMALMFLCCSSAARGSCGGCRGRTSSRRGRSSPRSSRRSSCSPSATSG
jgi:hypothetical protein